ncbi:hypothetical protein H4F99_08415 [Lysobacter sp. SG-8]|uniref:Tetratricopeptide repeat protein n=1 Tax=Marilutibacter penaei TaxID=2759900 RepID=A0A7W3U418_9GAMM|nr:hypothetical protein [Lysobacter penaei]MBB1088509.1 hypothetical protein [Lysobacter penaei]
MKYLPLLPALLCAACASPIVAPVEEVPGFDAESAVATIRGAGTADAQELDVQPLRDPQVADLLDEASALEGQHLYRAAAERIDLALDMAPADPIVLQRRAELALLLGEADEAERLALKAATLGTEVGPVCRQHWETALQARNAGSTPPREDGLPRVSPDELARRRDACTVAPPPRY